jgi:hypothetical protein
MLGMVFRSQSVLVLIAMLNAGMVQASRGFVGWPGSVERTAFCKTYGCVLTTALPPGDLGDRQDVYRLKKLPGALMRISVSTDDQSVTDADLEFRNLYYLSLSAGQKSAVSAFLQSMTGQKVAFSMNECRRSPNPMVALPPVLVDDGQGHEYQLNCSSMRAADVSTQGMPADFKPITLTAFEVQPKY